MKLLPLLLLSTLLIFTSCASMKSNKTALGSGPIDLSKKATSNSYGYTEENPIKVGGVVDGMGPSMERKFLNQLAGPNGETITYKRTKSCCSFKTPHGMMGQGLLDVYEIEYEGIGAPIVLYINMYDYEEPLIPNGFTRK